MHVREYPGINARGALRKLGKEDLLVRRSGECSPWDRSVVSLYAFKGVVVKQSIDNSGCQARDGKMVITKKWLEFCAKDGGLTCHWPYRFLVNQ